MSDQLSLFNCVDLHPMVEVQLVGAELPRPVIPKKPEPVDIGPEIKILDLVHILPWTDDRGRTHGAYYGKGVVVGKTSGMILVDIGVPGNPYPCSPWRIVTVD